MARWQNASAGPRHWAPPSLPSPGKEGTAEPPPLRPSTARRIPGDGRGGLCAAVQPGAAAPLPAWTSDLGGARGPLQILDLPQAPTLASLSHGKEPLGIRGHPAVGPLLRKRGRPRTVRKGWTRWGGSHPHSQGAPQEAPPRDRDGQSAREGAAGPAAVSAPWRGTQHVMCGPEAAPRTPCPAAALTPGPPARARCCGCAPTFPRPDRELRGAPGRARPIPPRPAPPQPQDPRPALTSGPRVAAAGLLVRHGRAAPARERSLRRSPCARAGPRPRPRRRSGRV